MSLTLLSAQAKLFHPLAGAVELEVDATIIKEKKLDLTLAAIIKEKKLDLTLGSASVLIISPLSPSPQSIGNS